MNFILSPITQNGDRASERASESRKKPWGRFSKVELEIGSTLRAKAPSGVTEKLDGNFTKRTARKLLLQLHRDMTSLACLERFLGCCRWIFDELHGRGCRAIKMDLESLTEACEHERYRFQCGWFLRLCFHVGRRGARGSWHRTIQRFRLHLHPGLQWQRGLRCKDQLSFHVWLW